MSICNAMHDTQPCNRLLAYSHVFPPVELLCWCGLFFFFLGCSLLNDFMVIWRKKSLHTLPFIFLIELFHYCFYSGGGILKVTVTSNLIVEGQMEADGLGGTSGGSGGSIWIDTRDLEGSGVISVSFPLQGSISVSFPSQGHIHVFFC